MLQTQQVTQVQQQGITKMQNLSTGEAAAVLQVSRDTVRRLCDRGELQFDRLEGSKTRFRVHSDSLEQYAERNGIRLNWNAVEQQK
jgi:excisionase family DNA binding protein